MPLPDILSQLSFPHPDREVTFHPPATRPQIRDFEAILKTPLLADLQEFYLFCNGFDTLDFLFRVLPLENIVQYGMRGRDCAVFLDRYRTGGLFGPEGLSYWSEESK